MVWGIIGGGVVGLVVLYLILLRFFGEYSIDKIEEVMGDAKQKLGALVGAASGVKFGFYAGMMSQGADKDSPEVKPLCDKVEQAQAELEAWQQETCDKLDAWVVELREAAGGEDKIGRKSPAWPKFEAMKQYYTVDMRAEATERVKQFEAFANEILAEVREVAGRG